MQLPHIHSNKSFIGLYSQSTEYVIGIRQSNVVCKTEVELGRRDSRFCLSKVSGKQSQVGQRTRNHHGHLVLTPLVGSCQV